MTSEERHYNRYLRRKQKKEMNREVVNYNDCFTFSNLWKSANRCFRGVRWKSSVKNYERRMFSNVAHAHYIMENYKYKPRKNKQFIIHERGKERVIDSTPIETRVIEKCFCDCGIVPLVSKSLIYDNSATLKGKGTWFCLERIKKYYAKFMKEYPNGYILILDFHSYFASIDHEILYYFIRHYVDDYCFDFYKRNVDTMEGLNLGSQLSQISAVYYAYLFDELCQSLSYFYARYMDDSIMFFRAKEDMNKAIKAIMKAIDSLHLVVNRNKVKRSKAIDGFTFLKKRFVYRNSKVIMYPYKKNDRIIKRKINRFRKAHVADYKPYMNGCLVPYRKTKAHNRYLSLLYYFSLLS